ncbi:unnamed protein product [Arabidopsis halleri]
MILTILLLSLSSSSSHTSLCLFSYVGLSYESTSNTPS